LASRRISSSRSTQIVKKAPANEQWADGLALKGWYYYTKGAPKGRLHWQRQLR
jgi:hypothetical protein